MDPRTLRRIFRAALKTSCLTSPLWLGGCGALHTLLPERISTKGLTEVCGPGSLVTELRSPVIPDVVQMREYMPWGEPTTRVSGFTGTACATATDVEACRAKLDALEGSSGFYVGGIHVQTTYSLAWTKGDEVAAVTTKEGLRTFLGPIDTGYEASLLIFAEGQNFYCGEEGPSGFREAKGGGFEVVTLSGSTCGEGTAFRRHLTHVSPDGVVTERDSEVLEYGDANCVIGRRPAGFSRAGDSHCETPLAHYLAAAAQLEAVSVEAFHQLGRELAAHGAPARLIRQSAIAADDEIRHTRATWRFAERRGATPVQPEVKRTPLRSLMEVALENRTEGCVRETFGALVAHHQATHARDPELRRALAVIAEDETRHASLSWQVDAWAREQLSASERAALREAQTRAISQLRAELEVPLHESIQEEAGMPSPAVALAMVDGLERELWG